MFIELGQPTGPVRIRPNGLSARREFADSKGKAHRVIVNFGEMDLPNVKAGDAAWLEV